MASNLNPKSDDGNVNVTSNACFETSMSPTIFVPSILSVPDRPVREPPVREPIEAALMVPPRVPSRWSDVADPSAPKLPLRIASGSDNRVGAEGDAELHPAVDIASSAAQMASTGLRSRVKSWTSVPISRPAKPGYTRSVCQMR